MFWEAPKIKSLLGQGSLRGGGEGLGGGVSG